MDTKAQNLTKKDQKATLTWDEFPPTPTQDWVKCIEKDLKGLDYENTLTWKIAEDCKVHPYYRSEDVEKLALAQTRPYKQSITRQRQNKGNDWEICAEVQVKGEDFAQANTQAKALLQHGIDSVAFCLPTGKTQAHQPEQVQQLLANIDCNLHTIHFFCGLAAPEFAQLLVATQQKQRNPTLHPNSRLDYDIFAHWTQESHLPYPLSEAFSRAQDLIELCRESLSGIPCLCVSGVNYHDATLDPLEELAFVLAAGHELLVHLQKGNVSSCSLENILSSIWFSLAISSDYFIEIARLRALRMLWQRIVQEYIGAGQVPIPHIHGKSARHNKTFYDPHSNILRSTTENMSAILGGVNSFTCIPFTEDTTDARNKSGQEVPLAEYLACNTQLIHRHEAYLDRVMDPVGGSYYIEKLSDLVAQKVWSRFQQIEQDGGLIQTLQSGKLQQHATKLSAQTLAQVATGKRTILGANQYPPNLQKNKSKVLPHPHKSSGDTVIPTVQEDSVDFISSKPLEAKAPYHEKIQALAKQSLAGQFEQLRFDTEKYASKGGHIPTVFLLSFGDVTQYKARIAFARNFFGCAGYEIIEQLCEGSLVDTIETLAKIKKNVIVVACSSDDAYQDLCWQKVQRALQGIKPEPLFSIVTEPKKIQFVNVFGYLYPGMDLLQELRHYQHHFGISKSILGTKHS